MIIAICKETLMTNTQNIFDILYKESPKCPLPCKKCSSKNTIQVSMFIAHCRDCNNWYASYETKELSCLQKPASGAAIPEKT